MAEIKKFNDSDFPYNLYSTPGANALDVLNDLNEDKESSFVIVGNKENLQYMNEGLDFISQSPSEILETCSSQRFPEDFLSHHEAQYKSIAEDLQNDPIANAMFSDLDDWEVVTTEMVLQDWPRDFSFQKKSTHPSAIIDYKTDFFYDQVILAELPTKYLYEVPAYLHFGGFNDCPEPRWHVSALKYLQNKYDAKLVSVTHDTLDIYFPKPPKGKIEAAEIMTWLYPYCADLVDQGSGSLGQTAREINRQNWWSLWWD